jgi:hypothetical protein
MAAGALGAQSISADLSAALDKQVSLKLSHTLPNALKLINEKTGVRIEADPVVYEVLPWGDQTNITASIENLTLRDALTAITRKLGLRFELDDNAVRLEPVPAALRVGKRLTLQELTLLDILSSTPLRHTENNLTLRQIIELTDGTLAQLEKDGTPAPGSSPGGGGYVVESRIPASGDGTASPLETLIPVSRNATLADALEAIPRSTGMTWYPWGKAVVVLKKEDQIRLLLQKPITVRYGGPGGAGVDVSQVLLELSKATRVPFAIEPGAVQRIPPEFRTVRLMIDNAPVQQILEQLSGTTGLGWTISDRVGSNGSGGSGGVYIWNNSPIPPGAGGPVVPPAGGREGAGARAVMLLPLKDGGQMIVTEADLPEDVRQYLRAKRQAEVEKLREQMRQEGYKPATRPAERSGDL